MSENDIDYSFTLYRSTEKDPHYTDEEDCCVGVFNMKRPYARGTSIKDEQIKVKLAFGHSDIAAVATSKNGESVLVEFSLSSC